MPFFLKRDKRSDVMSGFDIILIVFVIYLIPVLLYNLLTGDFQVFKNISDSEYTGEMKDG